MTPRRQTLLLIALVRCLAFPFGENVAGDSVVRTWLGLDWAQAPHLVLSWNDGVAQYGPLHIVLLGLVNLVWPNPLHAGRLLSLVFGIATAWPLMSLARRQFGARAEVATGLSFALWSLHIQCSTMAASEALCLFFVVACCSVLSLGFESRQRSHFALAGVLATLGCATRYDVWLWTPVVAVAVLLHTRRLLWASLFVGGAALFPSLWLLGNAVHAGDALAPIHDIDAFHRTWYQAELAFWGPVRLRVMALGFWPGAALISLSPLVALAGVAGVVRARRSRSAWWLLAILLLPPVPYLVRALFMHSFVPLSRFTVKELALLCVFVGPGLESLRWLHERWLVVSAAGWALALLGFTQLAHGNIAESVVPLAAIARNPVTVAEAIALLQRETTSPDGVLVLDADPATYDELQIKFYSGLPRSRVANVRAADFEYVLSTGQPKWLARFVHGTLAVEDLDATHVKFRGGLFELVAPTTQPVRVYRRVD